MVAIIRAKINSGLMPPQAALALLVGGAGGLVARWVGLLTPAFTGLDLATCVIGSAPGGAEQMVLLAGELGGDVRLVAAMHISRQVVLMVGLPFLLRALAPARPKQPCPLPELD